MRIKKVKRTKEDKIHVEYEQRNKNGTWDEFSMTCAEEGKPELYTAFDALAEHVIEMCELPEDYVDRVIVRGVSASYAGEGGVMGATITAQLRLDNSNTNLNLNTPHKAEEPYCADSDPADVENQILPDGCADAIYDLFGEAEKYVRGERKQLKLAV